MSTDKTVVLITGANSGIGFETALALGSLSPKYLILIGARNPAKAAAALSDLKSRNLPSTYAVLDIDVTNASSIQSALSTITSTYGRLDILINNAGITSRDPDLLTQFRTTFETNTFAPAIVTETFLPLLEKSADPRLVYVSSGLGSFGWRSDPSVFEYPFDFAVYRMSKAALDMLALNQHEIFKKEGKRTRVWAFDPGYSVSNLSGTGEKGVEERKKMGAQPADVPGKALAGLVDGQHDADVGKFISHSGKVIPW